jgi:competence protein ComEA
MKQKKWLKTGLMILFILVSGIFYSCRENNQQSTQLSVKSLEESFDTVKTEEEAAKDMEEQTDITTNISEEKFVENQETKELIYVHLCGEVKNPDVYQVEKGTRLFDIIKLAGGLTEEAAGEYVNQAAALSDGQQVYIPSKTEVKDKSPMNQEVAGEKELLKVNINTADVNELMTLPGIGEAKAESIINYRQEHGEFKAIEDIKNISGIKDSAFNKIKDKIMVK